MRLMASGRMSELGSGNDCIKVNGRGVVIMERSTSLERDNSQPCCMGGSVLEVRLARHSPSRFRYVFILSVARPSPDSFHIHTRAELCKTLYLDKPFGLQLLNP
jgi:hypothetical protein